MVAYKSGVICLVGINHGAVHDDGACANGGMLGDVGSWRDDRWQAKAKLDGLLEEPDPFIRRADLPHGNEGILIIFGQFWQFSICSDDGITEMLAV